MSSNSNKTASRNNDNEGGSNETRYDRDKKNNGNNDSNTSNNRIEITTVEMIIEETCLMAMKEHGKEKNETLELHLV